MRGARLLLEWTKTLHTCWLVARLDPLSMAELLNLRMPRALIRWMELLSCTHASHITRAFAHREGKQIALLSGKHPQEVFASADWIRGLLAKWA